MNPTPLPADAIAPALSKLPGWTGDENGITRRLAFADFRGAMRFMQACVEGIERLNHHPIWTNALGEIEIRLVTYDAGHKLSALDIELATFFEEMLRERGAEFGYRVGG